LPVRRCTTIDTEQLGKLHQLRLQPALFVMVFDRAAKIHAPFVLLLATGAGFEIDIGFAVLGHVLFSRNRIEGRSASKQRVTP